MKFKIKKYLYLLNDVTDALLKKDRKEKAEKLRKILIIVSIVLVLSIIINIYYFIK